MTLPNMISLARLMSVPVAIYLIMHGYFAAAFWLFVAAGISDAVDGYIATRHGQASPLGGYLDPLADKALLVGVYVTLGYTGQLPSWIVILVVFRDIIIIGGVVLLHIFDENVRMKPLLISKANTAAQIVLAVFVLAELGVGLTLGPVGRMALVYIVACTTVASGGAYVLGWGRHVEATAGGDKPPGAAE